MSNPSSFKKDPGQARAAAIYAQLATHPARAWKEARQALGTFPKSERLRFVAGLALIALGKKPEARKQFAEAIRLGTPAPDAYLNLALLSAETGHPDFALDTLDRAAARFGDDLGVMTARVNVHRTAGDPPRALAAAEAAVAAHPDAADLQVLRAVLLAETGQLLAAIGALETLLTHHPDHVIARINLGRFLAFTNQPQRALEVTEKAHALAPAHPAVLENLAIRRREAGDFAGAAALFADLMALAPDHAPEALRQLADIAPEAQLGALAAEIETQAGQARGGEARARLGFARASLARRQGDDPGFARALKEANRAMAKLRPYAARADRDLHERALAQFDAEAPPPVTPDPPLPAQPVFIMGLPRSGTTLLERMLSSAPETAGLGEVALINRYVADHLARGAPLTDGLGDLRRDYAAYQRLAGPARWSIDKMPANYIHMGWIARAFPEAKLIVMRRDRRDVALSIFEAYFDDPGQNFAFTEDGIAARLALFEETEAAWRARDVERCDVSYEDLVSAPDPTLRRIAAFSGLPFDEAMLKPQDNTGSIRTASSVQARREINRDSIARWQRYPDLLPGIFG